MATTYVSQYSTTGFCKFSHFTVEIIIIVISFGGPLTSFSWYVNYYKT